MKTKSRSTGKIIIDSVGLTGVIPVFLKLLGIIKWSWWVVTSPFWGGGILIILFCLAIWAMFIIAINEHEKREKKSL